MQWTVGIPLAMTAVFGGAFFTNEWSHGAMAESIGVGHHHMFDFGGLHCVSHTDEVRGDAHLEHMHGSSPMPHAHCPGGSGMHEGRGGMTREAMG